MKKISVFSASVSGAFGMVAENFGDNLMDLLLPRIFGVEPHYVDHSRAELIGVGSILDAYHRRKSGLPPWKRRPWRQLHVWGSGFLDSDGLLLWPQKVHVCAVRGPLSCKKLKLSSVPLGDPALLLPRIIHAEQTSPEHEVAIIPHFATYRAFIHRFGADIPRHWQVVNLTDDPTVITQQISRSETVISSSLHGLIVADAYGIPSRRLEGGEGIKGDGFKYRDYEAFRCSAFSEPVSFEHFLRNPKATVQTMDDPCRPAANLLDDLIAAFPF